jgi:hypothetical protein
VRAPLVGGGLLALAAVVHWGLTLPLERRTSLSLLELKRLEAERRQAASRMASLERREALDRRLAAAFSPAVVSSMGTVRAVRLSVVDSLDDVDVSGVRLSVRAGLARTTKVSVVAHGDFDDVVRLSAHLVRPGTGLVLERATFNSRASQVDLSLQAMGVGAAP